MVNVKVPYNTIYIKKIKDIKGHGWNPEEKCWFSPHYNNIVRELFDLFNDKNIWLDFSLKEQKEIISRKYKPKTVKVYIAYNTKLEGYLH